MSIKFLCHSNLDLGLHGLKIRDLLLHTPPTTFYRSCTHGCMDNLLWSSYTVIRNRPVCMRNLYLLVC